MQKVDHFAELMAKFTCLKLAQNKLSGAIVDVYSDLLLSADPQAKRMARDLLSIAEEFQSAAVRCKLHAKTLQGKKPARLQLYNDNFAPDLQPKEVA